MAILKDGEVSAFVEHFITKILFDICRIHKENRYIGEEKVKIGYTEGKAINAKFRPLVGNRTQQRGSDIYSYNIRNDFDDMTKTRDYE